MKKIILAIVCILILALAWGGYAYVQKSKKEAVENDQKIISSYIAAYTGFHDTSLTIYNDRVLIGSTTLQQTIVQSIQTIALQKKTNLKVDAATKGYDATNAILELNQNDPAYVASGESLKQLISFSSMIKNKKVRDEALKGVSISNEVSQNEKNYAAAFQQKYALMAKLFKAIVDAKGDMNSYKVSAAETDFNAASNQTSSNFDATEGNLRASIVKLTGFYSEFVDVARSEGFEVSENKQ